ncbi:MAG TPA: hypothetical protein VF453_20210 [Burkholderiaceae bacterium]
MSSRKLGATLRSRAKIGLIFGEDKNDADALARLAEALWPDAPRFKYVRKPLVLIRSRQEAEDRKRNAAGIADAIRAEGVLHDVAVVIAHRDCDAVEPAHELQAHTIRSELENAGVKNVIPAAPAWETEAWWFLWPDAVAAVHSKWTRLKRVGNHGMIKDAAEQLARDLRNKSTRREYEKSDAGAIANNVRNFGLIDRCTGTSASFLDFRRRVRVVAGLEIE